MPQATLNAQADVTITGTPSTILITDLLGHNTSAALNYIKANYPNNFTGQSNKDGTYFAVDSNIMDDSMNPASPMHVSKISLRTLMPPNWPGKFRIWAEFYGGLSSHPPGGYGNQYTSSQRNIDDMMSRGADGAILNYYGANYSNAPGDAALDLIAAALPTGKEFSTGVDQQYLTSHFSTSQYQQAILDLITHLNTRYFGNPKHEKKSGRPVIRFWDFVTHTLGYVDWNVVRTWAQSHGNPLFIFYQNGGFTAAQTDGSFSWQSSGADTPTSPYGTTYLDSFLSACAAHQSLICDASVICGFNGTLTRSASWSLGKYVVKGWPTYQAWWAKNRDFVLSGKRLDDVIQVTWDDWQEGSPIQNGILNDVVVHPTLSGTTLSFTVTGDETSVAKYNLYDRLGSATTATLLASILTSATKSFNLSLLNIPVGSHTLYIQAQGMPCVSDAIATSSYTVIAPIPISVTIDPLNATLQVNNTQVFTATVQGTGTTTVTWTTDGGTVVAGFYTAPSAAGIYHVTATSTADTSKSATATVVVTAAPVVQVVVSIVPNHVAQGEGATLTWDSTNAISVTIDNGIGSVALDGSMSVAPLVSTTYMVTATGSTSGTASALATLTVTPVAPPPVIPPTVTAPTSGLLNNKIDTTIVVPQPIMATPEWLKKLTDNHRKYFEQLSGIVNGKLTFGDSDSPGNINGSWITLTTPATADTDFVVVHNLGRIPSGYIIMSKSAPCSIYTGSVPPDTVQATLRADAANVALNLFIV